jgi:hypothetical protein
MPPLSTITLTQPDWLQQELKSISEQVNKKQKSILFFIFMLIVILRTIIRTMIIVREKLIIFNKKGLIL